MKLSSRGRYGTRVLLDIAMHNGEGPVPLRDIARRQQIPLAYLKRLITTLVGAGVMRSLRGVGGGVLLARLPQQVNLLEVIRLLEGTSPLVECIDRPEVCERSRGCATRDLWTELDRAARQVLESTTLEDLVERQKIKDKNAGEMYYI
ncbi:MAG TPA: Rrf2 family transcriptional regulator [Dehalococcoidales bacterium]|nr:Rrf2 family transcriptional regulator [Dehalococcoidales bacterium]